MFKFDLRFFVFDNAVIAYTQIYSNGVWNKSACRQGLDIFHCMSKTHEYKAPTNLVQVFF